MHSKNSRKRKLNYDDEAIDCSAKPLSDKEAITENVVEEEWKRRMESFEINSSTRKKMFPEQKTIPASLVAKRFINSANSFQNQPSQESEIDIDWLPSSDEGESHIYDFQETYKASQNITHAKHESHCPNFSGHDESTSDIEIVSSPAVRSCPLIHCKPDIDRNPVLRHSPVIDSSPDIHHYPATETSPVMKHRAVLKRSPILHSPIIERSPIIQCSPVIESSAVIRHSPVIECSPVIQRSPVIDCSPVIQCSPIIENSPIACRDPVDKRSPVIHSQRRGRSSLQKSLFHLSSCTGVDKERKTMASYPTDNSDDGNEIESVSGRHTDIPSQLSLSQVPISQYESHEDDDSTSDDENEEDDCSDETVSISSPPDSQLESNPEQLVPVSAISSKGKDLIEGLQRYFVTPEKGLRADDDTAAAESSTKKRQKFVKGGLAERLSKLVSRQRTATSCWLHKNRKTSGNADADRVLVCDVTSCMADHGHLVTKCRVTRGNVLDVSSLTDSIVLFSHETAQRCRINCGSHLKIYPPWQSLKLDNLEVVLNSNLCQVESQEGEYRVDGQEPNEYGECRVNGQEVNETLVQDRILTSWTCSCSLDPSSCSAVCRQSLGFALGSSVSRGPSAGSGNFGSAGFPLGGNTSMAFKSTCSLSTIVPLAQEKTLLSSSILESIEQKGGSVAMEIDFYATVQRVFCRYAQCDSWSGENRVSLETGSLLQTGSMVQWSLLVQDLHGFLCEVILPRSFPLNSAWHEVATAALGSQWAFYNLQIGRRLTRPKFSRLFSVIDSVWKPDSSSDVVSLEDSASSHHEICPPSFCYALNAADAGASCRLWSHACGRVFSPHSFRSLESVVLDNASGRGRVSFGARLLHKLESELVQHFYVTDSSLQEKSNSARTPYIVVIVGSAVVVGSDCSKQLPIVFHDVFMEAGQFLADEYSRVMVRGSHWLPSVMDFSPRLPLLTTESDLHSLVSVSGCITDVDQDTACTWSVCDLCENSELGTSLQNSFLYCHNCKRPVTNPTTKMKLDISLAVSAIPSAVVKVKLLQNTIEKLLPSTENDQGYDIEQVLGHQIIQLTCFVTAVVKIGQCITEMLIDEINLDQP